MMAGKFKYGVKKILAFLDITLGSLDKTKITKSEIDR